jgi:hypothetical protein
MGKFRREAAPGKIAISLLVILVCLLFTPLTRAVADETDDIVQSAESLFKAMKQKDYTGIWMELTVKSRKTIAEEVYKKTRDAARTAYSVGTVEKDFAEGGPVAIEYWDAFLHNFDPDDVLEYNEWEMGPVKRDTAEIRLLHKNAENAARLRMFKENGRWKVGLVETFWNRK